MNRYNNVEHLPRDGKVVAVFCGGPVKYNLKSDAHATDQFLKDVVCPGIFKHFENDPDNKIGRERAVACC